MTLIETRDKSLTAKINGTTIHSKYSPIKEADKFLSSKLVNLDDTSTVVIIGPGIGYLYTSILKTNSKVRVIGIPLDEKLAKLSLEENRSGRVQWDNKTSIHDFLKKNINMFNIKGIQIIEWSPVVKAFPERYKEVSLALLSYIRRLNGNILTTARFGRLWLRNSIKNYININSYIYGIEINKPVIIVASGSSLNSYINFLKEIREKVFVIALSSANLALKHFNINPDIVFSTDPGYYSKLHINKNEEILACPLTNSTSTKENVLLLNQNIFFEKQILTMDHIPNFCVNENGTVAGTALEFALKHSSYPIFLVGQDLESSDIKSHVSPYSFENLLKKSESKVEPYYSIMYKRWSQIGVTYKTYRDWYSMISKQYKNRIFRLNEHSNKIDGIEDIDKEFVRSTIRDIKNNSRFNFSTFQQITKEDRIKNVKSLLTKWLNSIDNKDFDENPLFYLISTSKYTDTKNMTILSKKNELLKECREESRLFIEGLLVRYGRKLL
ncbi:DUF115 domain-containing protein [Thiospirochaeta perfilievii]|uniref:DUF115 domain-containing protein n=1 Tax=Thiospirochaeta perfilievii TaxID=252967 RepID=A0A5C1QB40_9SPIO|nr:6-hydroxymethylpterin diphosphokinase MptE-like protein [Thiospirochaeta perfilievii]QEN04270.1 DUF115 domain-containing protein [Thiospirochaeta perfilievii]